MQKQRIRNIKAIGRTKSYQKNKTLSNNILSNKIFCAFQNEGAGVGQNHTKKTKPYPIKGTAERQGVPQLQTKFDENQKLENLELSFEIVGTSTFTPR